LKARVVQLSDIHFGGEHPPALAAVAEFLKREPFDLLLVTGDITSFGTRDEFKTASVWFKSLPGPQLFTPGNHDTPWAGVVDRLFYPFARYRSVFGDPGRDGFDAPGVSVQALNTARGWQVRLNWSKGEIFRRQTVSAIQRLGESGPGALKVIACHHPLMEVVGGPITARVRGGRQAAQRFAESGVDVVLTGHLHTPFAVPYPFGDGRTYAVGCGTLSLRERGFPPSFNVIEAEADCITIKVMAWTGSQFEPSRTWALPRRAVVPSA
jgi:3',5'-cyclic AMP phosphodiesterase CpdA